MVLPEDVCERLGAVAEAEARTVSNMARVLIQQGLEVYEQQQAALRAAAAPAPAATAAQDTDNFARPSSSRIRPSPSACVEPPGACALTGPVPRAGLGPGADPQHRGLAGAGDRGTGAWMAERMPPGQ